MRTSILALALASTAALGACTANPRTNADIATGAAVGGLAGAVWADRNNDGVVDGYVYNGQYYPGAPAAGMAPPPPPAPAPMPAAGERG